MNVEQNPVEAATKTRAAKPIADGTRVVSRDGVLYLTSHDGRTLARMDPRVRGKAAVKRHKRARQAARKKWAATNHDVC